MRPELEQLSTNGLGAIRTAVNPGALRIKARYQPSWCVRTHPPKLLKGLLRSGMAQPIVPLQKDGAIEIEAIGRARPRG
eukprot:scaffold42336_cov36-Tisochrysis_lutea.AAC.2